MSTHLLMPMAVFQKTLVRASETRSFHVEADASRGWRTVVSANNRIAHEKIRTEWHRVERDIAAFAREIEELQRQGWHEG
jgi:hypothetical protein